MLTAGNWFPGELAYSRTRSRGEFKKQRRIKGTYRERRSCRFFFVFEKFTRQRDNSAKFMGLLSLLSHVAQDYTERKQENVRGIGLTWLICFILKTEIAAFAFRPLVKKRPAESGRKREKGKEEKERGEEKGEAGKEWEKGREKGREKSRSI